VLKLCLVIKVFDINNQNKDEEELVKAIMESGDCFTNIKEHYEVLSVPILKGEQIKEVILLYKE